MSTCTAFTCCAGWLDKHGCTLGMASSPRLQMGQHMLRCIAFVQEHKQDGHMLGAFAEHRWHSTVGCLTMQMLS